MADRTERVESMESDASSLNELELRQRAISKLPPPIRHRETDQENTDEPGERERGERQQEGVAIPVVEPSGDMMTQLSQMLQNMLQKHSQEFNQILDQKQGKQSQDLEQKLDAKLDEKFKQQGFEFDENLKKMFKDQEQETIRRDKAFSDRIDAELEQESVEIGERNSAVTEVNNVLVQIENRVTEAIHEDVDKRLQKTETCVNSRVDTCIDNRLGRQLDSLKNKEDIVEENKRHKMIVTRVKRKHESKWRLMYDKCCRRFWIKDVDVSKNNVKKARDNRKKKKQVREQDNRILESLTYQNNLE